MNTIERIQFVRHRTASHRRHYVDEEDVKVVLSRLPEEVWRRLRKVHFKDVARGRRVLGYTTKRGRRDVTLCALPHHVSLKDFGEAPEEFGAITGSQWPLLAVRRYHLYNTFLHELGHLQVILPKESNPNRKFAREPIAQGVANYWRGEMWSQPFDHPDPVHNPPSPEEMSLLEAGWVDSHLAYKKGYQLEQAADREDAVENRKQAIRQYQRSVDRYPIHALALERLGILSCAEVGEATEEESLLTAVELFRSALAIDRTLPDSTLYLARALARLGQRNEASQMFKRAMQICEPAHIAMASYAAQLGNWGDTSEAARLFPKALKKDPRCSYTLPRYAEFLLFRSDDPEVADTKKAVDFLKRYIANEPNDAKAHYHLGVAYARLDGCEAEAIVHLRRSMEAEPDGNPARGVLSRLELSAAGSSDEAIAKYTETLRVDLEGPALHFKRGNAWRRKGEHDNAITEFSHTMRLDPENVKAYFYRGWAWQEKGELDKAIADYSETIRLDPESDGAYNNRGLAWRAKGAYDRAIEDYSKAIELEPEDPGGYHRRGHAWDDKGEYDEAIKDYSKAIELQPDRATAYFDRGITWSNKGETDNAIEDYTKAIELGYTDSYTNRGTMWLRKRRNDKAIQDFTIAIEADPENARAYNNRGMAESDFERAIDDLNKAIELDPDYAIAYYNRGIVWSKNGGHENAINDFSKAVELDCDFMKAYWLRGDSLCAICEYERSIEDYTTSIELDSKDGHVHIARGTAWKKKDEYEKAIEDWTKGIELAYGDDHCSSRSDAWSDLGEYDRAIKELNEAIKLDPSDDYAYGLRGELWWKRGDYDRAIEDYTRASELAPEDEDWYSGRGNASRDKGHFDAAIQDYRKALELAPEDTDANNNLAWLLATCPIDACRNGEEAVQCAIRACESTNWRIITHIDTLAAAHAEMGDFDQAVQYQTRVLELSNEADNKEEAQSRLELYKNGRPYREQCAPNARE